MKANDNWVLSTNIALCSLEYVLSAALDAVVDRPDLFWFEEQSFTNVFCQQNVLDQ
jgi:hypothetical protein